MRTGLFAIAVMLAAGACGGDSTAPVAEAGSYALISVNGVNVPTVVTENASIKSEVLSGTLQIGSDKTFSETRQGRVTLTGGSPSPITSTQSGTWSITRAS